MGTLYLIATPIGNLEDITPRALRLLGQAGTVAAEDTRTARRLLTHYSVRAKLLSYNDHNRRSRIPQILDLLGVEDVALISEAGTPAISDPGQELVSAAIEREIRVVSIPGASAVLTALTVSGLPTRQFLYLGFLPRRPGERRSMLRDVATETRTLVCFEAPSRLRASLRDMLVCLGDRRIAVCRELTKLHEETLRGTISELLARDVEPRGEYTVVIEGSPPPPEAQVDKHALGRLSELWRQGASAREATTRLSAELGLPRKRLYEAWLKLHGASKPE
ncbi:MAG TPA: 16S rRNA (cytidine(1402)-2'-O)-methyltransferase [Dehalococcoidia bacterium]|nr:16S rRNA (cytidine(1402)-2'-O)-methyltransferase [Dehalococcoidia bacterium]